jgi:hypothetical protein
VHSEKEFVGSKSEAGLAPNENPTPRTDLLQIMCATRRSRSSTCGVELIDSLTRPLLDRFRYQQRLGAVFFRARSSHQRRYDRNQKEDR